MCSFKDQTQQDQSQVSRNVKKFLLTKSLVDSLIWQTESGRIFARCAMHLVQTHLHYKRTRVKLTRQMQTDDRLMKAEAGR